MFMWTEKVSEIDPRMWLLQLHTVAKIKFMSKNSIIDLKIAVKQKYLETIIGSNYGGTIKGKK